MLRAFIAVPMGPFLEAGEAREVEKARGNTVRPETENRVSSSTPRNNGEILGLSDDEEEGEEGERAIGVKIPNKPTQEEVDEHELTHIPFRIGANTVYLGKLRVILTGK